MKHLFERLVTYGLTSAGGIGRLIGRLATYIVVRSVYSEEALLMPRFSKRNVLQAISNARKRFKDHAQYYYISDSMPLRVNVLRTIGSIDNLMGEERENEIKVFICAFESDEKLIHILQKIKEMREAYYALPVKGLPTSRYFHTNDRAKAVLFEEIKKQTAWTF
jgi:hypothetical protein